MSYHALSQRRGAAHPKRRCAVCPGHFTPRWAEQQTCGGRCKNILTGRKLRGRRIPAFDAMVAQHRAEHRTRIETLCLKRFKELSVREIDLFRFAVRVGYDRGYARGYHHRRRANRKESSAA